jgi:DNA-binding beta-propeller fold protein YncE
MRNRNFIRAWLTAVCAGLVMGAVSVPAQAAEDPIYVFSAPKNGQPVPVPPGTGFNGLCGFAVDGSSNLYVSDYYHHAVDVFSSNTGAPVFQKQLANVDPLDGPCGLAIDSAGKLYVNDFHRNVVRYAISPFPFGFTSTFSSGTLVDSQESTGVAVQQGTNRVFVDDRDHVSVYDPSGALLEVIGVGSLLDGYGVAVNGGKVYVADAGTDTVKLYESAVSTTTPTAIVSGPAGGFDSLVDSALAVDAVNGDLYVADRVGSRLTEHPEAVIDVFAADGSYKGHLKYNVVDGTPVGLAVDNSVGASQGRVYVTSGNGEGASFYAYTPNAATFSSSQPAVFSLSVLSSGVGAGAVTGQAGGIDCATACEIELSAGSELSLTATPDAGFAFAGWSGACAGGGECAVAMDRAKTVSAEFVPLEGGPIAAPPAPGMSLGAAAAGSVSTPAARKRHHRVKHRHQRRHKRGHR